MYQERTRPFCFVAEVKQHYYFPILFNLPVFPRDHSRLCGSPVGLPQKNLWV